MKKRIRTAIYCRVASRQPEDRDMAESQKYRLRAYADSTGRLIVNETVEYEKGISIDRPGVKSLRQLAVNHQIDEILVVNADRVCRNTKELIDFISAMKDYNVNVTTPSGDLSSRFLSIFGE